MDDPSTRYRSCSSFLAKSWLWPGISALRRPCIATVQVRRYSGSSRASKWAVFAGPYCGSIGKSNLETAGAPCTKLT